MVLGLPLATFTAIHVVISLVGIGTGIVAVSYTHLTLPTNREV